MPTNLTSGQVPVPQPAPSAQSRIGAVTSAQLIGTLPALVQGDSVDVCAKLNNLISELRNAALLGCGGIGVATGLVISAGSGLALSVSAGFAMTGDGPLSVGALSIVLPDESTRYIWLNSAGTLTAASTTTAPNATAVYLGRAVTTGGAIAGVDDSGVVRIAGSQLFRTLADRGAPGDVPKSPVMTITQAGSYLFDGAAHRQTGPTFYAATLTGDITLNERDADVLALTPSGANRKVILPASASYASRRKVLNTAASGGPNLLVRNPADSATVATLTPGQMSIVAPVIGSTGSPVYTSDSLSTPSTTVTA